MYNQFEKFVEYLDETYGCIVVYDEETGLVESVECPECGEPILFADWSDVDTMNWTTCPICDWHEVWSRGE